MTVKQLQDKLDQLDPNAEIVIKPANSRYAGEISNNIRGAEIIAMWGPNYEAFVLCGKEQTGSISW